MEIVNKDWPNYMDWSGLAIGMKVIYVTQWGWQDFLFQGQGPNLNEAS